MSEAYEVPEPILNSPFEEPAWHWHIEDGQTPEKIPCRRPAIYYYRDPNANPSTHGGMGGTPVDLTLVNLIRERVKAWRSAGYPGVTRTTLELLHWWRREGRYAREAACCRGVIVKSSTEQPSTYLDVPMVNHWAFWMPTFFCPAEVGPIWPATSGAGSTSN